MSEKEYIKDQVTVVIPVYNEERFLWQALESVVEQVDCVIIGDNASSDGTEAICREFAEKYPHIKYFRHEKNFGNVWNGIYCYKLVETEFVFQIGGHDLIPPNYVTALKETLKANPDAICAYADCQFIDCDGNNILREEYSNPSCQNEQGKMMAPLLAEKRSLIRACDFVFKEMPCRLIYGLFRTQDIIVDWTIHYLMAGPDNFVLFKTLLKGRFIHSPHTEFIYRDIHHMIEYPNQYISKSYMERITGVEMDINYKPMIDLIMESYCNTKTDNLTHKEKKRLYRRLRYWFSNHFGYSGNFGLDSFNNVSKYLRISIFNLLLILYRFYPLKFFYRLLKSAIVPGYFEKWKKNELDKKDESDSKSIPKIRND
jgi:glycosyltransferase involved in cell wall biosynthesis